MDSEWGRRRGGEEQNDMSIEEEKLQMAWWKFLKRATEYKEDIKGQSSWEERKSVEVIPRMQGFVYCTPLWMHGQQDEQKSKGGWMEDKVMAEERERES